MKADNLYQHADGGFYCLLNDDAPIKAPRDCVGEETEWQPGVIYIGPDGVMRSTTRARWDDRFQPVAEYTEDDEDVMSMIRRANPGNSDFDFVRVFESWHESEVSLTSEMLTLAVAATLIQTRAFTDGKQVLTIKTSDLQDVAANYMISKEPIPHGFVFKVEMISE